MKTTIRKCRRKKERDRYSSAIFVLVLATILCLLFYWYDSYYHLDGAKEFPLAIGSATFSVLVTILTINRSDEKRDSKNRENMTRLAFSELVDVLNKHLVLIQRTFVSDRSQPRIPMPLNVDGLLQSDFVLVLRNLDLAQPAGLNPNMNTTWATHFGHSLRELKRQLGDTLARFGHSLDSEDAMLIANLKNCDLVTYLLAASLFLDFLHTSGNTNFAGVNVMTTKIDEISDFGTQLLSVIKRINDFLGESQGIKLDPLTNAPNNVPFLFTE